MSAEKNVGISQYIQQCIAKKLSRSDIVNGLVKNNWEKADAEKAVSDYFKKSGAKTSEWMKRKRFFYFFALPLVIIGSVIVYFVSTDFHLKMPSESARAYKKQADQLEKIQIQFGLLKMTILHHSGGPTTWQNTYWEIREKGIVYYLKGNCPHFSCEESSTEKIVDIDNAEFSSKEISQIITEASFLRTDESTSRLPEVLNRFFFIRAANAQICSDMSWTIEITNGARYQELSCEPFKDNTKLAVFADAIKSILSSKGIPTLR